MILLYLFILKFNNLYYVFLIFDLSNSIEKETWWALSMLSLKGKKASEAKATPLSWPIQLLLSSALRATGICSNRASHDGRSSIRSETIRQSIHYIFKSFLVSKHIPLIHFHFSFHFQTDCDTPNWCVLTIFGFDWSIFESFWRFLNNFGRWLAILQPKFNRFQWKWSDFADFHFVLHQIWLIDHLFHWLCSNFDLCSTFFINWGHQWTISDQIWSFSTDFCTKLTTFSPPPPNFGNFGHPVTIFKQILTKFDHFLLISALNWPNSPVKRHQIWILTS